MTDNRNTLIYLPKGLRGRLNAEAKRTRRNLSEVIRAHIENSLSAARPTVKGKQTAKKP